MTYPTGQHILALDMATCCGWSRLSRVGELYSGSQSFKRHANQHPGASLAMFSNWLRETLNLHCPTSVIFEDAGFFKSAMAVEICVGMRGILLAATANKNIPVHRYAPMTVKKFFTGSGKSDKHAMMKECARRWPERVIVDSNESDALALLHLHLAKCGHEELQLLQNP